MKTRCGHDDWRDYRAQDGYGYEYPLARHCDTCGQSWRHACAGGTYYAAAGSPGCISCEALLHAELTGRPMPSTSAGWREEYVLTGEPVALGRMLWWIGVEAGEPAPAPSRYRRISWPLAAAAAGALVMCAWVSFTIAMLPRWNWRTGAVLAVAAVICLAHAGSVAIKVIRRTRA